MPFEVDPHFFSLLNSEIMIQKKFELEMKEEEKLH